MGKSVQVEVNCFLSLSLSVSLGRDPVLVMALLLAISPPQISLMRLLHSLSLIH